MAQLKQLLTKEEQQKLAGIPWLGITTSKEIGDMTLFELSAIALFVLVKANPDGTAPQLTLHTECVKILTERAKEINFNLF